QEVAGGSHETTTASLAGFFTTEQSRQRGQSRFAPLSQPLQDLLSVHKRTGRASLVDSSRGAVLSGRENHFPSPLRAGNSSTHRTDPRASRIADGSGGPRHSHAGRR